MADLSWASDSEPRGGFLARGGDPAEELGGIPEGFAWTVILVRYAFPTFRDETVRRLADPRPDELVTAEQRRTRLWFFEMLLDPVVAAQFEEALPAELRNTILRGCGQIRDQTLTCCSRTVSTSPSLCRDAAAAPVRPSGLLSREDPSCKNLRQFHTSVHQSVHQSP